MNVSYFWTSHWNIKWIKCKKIQSDTSHPQCSRRADVLEWMKIALLWGFFLMFIHCCLGDKVAQTNFAHKKWRQTKKPKRVPTNGEVELKFFRLEGVQESSQKVRFDLKSLLVWVKYPFTCGEGLSFVVPVSSHGQLSSLPKKKIVSHDLFVFEGMSLRLHNLMRCLAHEQSQQSLCGKSKLKADNWNKKVGGQREQDVVHHGKVKIMS